MESKNKYFFKDMNVMFRRSMRHISRSTENYVNYLLPGIMLMAIGSGIAYVAYRLFIDKQRGIFERFHSMPIARSTVLWGHVLTSIISNGISVVVIILVALLMCFRSSAGILEWLAVFGILGVFTLVLTWCIAIIVVAYIFAMRIYKK